ncbi:MAG: cystathionine beta-synthase [Methanobacteriota archaeon]|nr:MAG: cystathionine beta-synthase [Euryarchaeota archaeon]
MGHLGTILEAIGNTPLIRLNRITEGLKPLILAKAEFLNPGGSVKDRIGIAMIKAAEKKGALKPGGTIVEPTSGNTGIGLALVAALKGYRCIFTIPDKQSQEKVNLLKALGARVVVCRTAVPPDHPESYYKVAERLHKEIPNSVLPYQYYNPANPEAHYRSTGPEIWEQTGGKITHFVCGMGTGGTISGAGKFLKEKNRKVKVIGVDPLGSILKDYFYTKEMTKPHTYKIEGIGEDFIPETTWFNVIDEIVKVSDKEAYLMTRRLAREEALLVGSSSGAAVSGALKVAEGLGEDDVLVVLLPDTGERYLSKAHNEEWLKEHGFLEEPTAPLMAILRRKERIAGIVAVEAGATVREAVDMMRDYDISQLPVMDKGKVVGSVQEAALIQKLLKGKKASEKKVRDVMDKPFPMVDPGTPLDRIYKMLMRGSPAVVVGTDRKLEGIVTRIDVIEYLAERA